MAERKFKRRLWTRTDVEPMVSLIFMLIFMAIFFILIFLPNWNELTRDVTGIQFFLIIMALFIGFLCFSAVVLAILWRNYQRAFPMLYPETVRLMEGVLSSASLSFEATVNEGKSRLKSRVIFVVSSLNLRIRIGGPERPNRMVGAIS